MRRAHNVVPVLVVGLLGVVATLGWPAGDRMTADDLAVYTDSLAAGWESWSWDCTVNLASGSPRHAGTAAIAVTFTSSWAGLYLHVAPSVAADTLQSVRFWVHGGNVGGQHINLAVYDENGGYGDIVAVTPVAGAWTLVEVPLASLGSPGGISGLVWQDATGESQPTWHLDDVVLVARTGPPPPPPTPGPGPVLAVDASADRKPINPDIYGTSYASEQLATELRLPLRRWGGNSTSRFNWQVDTTNTGSDWFFENIAEEPGAPDRFVEQDRRTGARTILTVPLLGWVAKRRLESHPYDCGFKVSRYGAQQSVDSWDPDCGNGVRSSGTTITGNDPADTSVATTPGFVQNWIGHLVSTFGAAAQGGVSYYSLDNEPMLWSSTHRDVHPAPTSYDEMRDRTFAYAAAVKAGDPTARTLGPVVWGWTAYFWSALDWAAGGNWWENPPDRLAHGNIPFVEWYLQQMAAYDQQHGTRLLDYLDVHFYPPEVALTGAGSSAQQALRLRSTRLLWDPTYSEENWIAAPVYLVPRLKGWVAARYPGTRTAVTEYNWGALDHINGALAQADVLGIFGREGLDMAVLWGTPEPTQPGAFAFRMYRNVDGQGGAFGDVSVRAQSADQAQLAVYGAERSSDGALTAMVVNKTAGPLTSALTLAGVVPSGPLQVWRYSGAHLAGIVREPDLPFGQGALSVTFPAQSITLLVAPTAVAITFFSPVAGVEGTVVTITGTGFTGATAVRFGGVPSAFVVDDAAKITATVPAGAVTGPITVTTPEGTATSSSDFTVGGLRGDADGNGALQVGDVFYLINHLFAGGPPPLGNGDASSDSAVTVSDVFFLINYLFAAGPAPAGS
ncbi:MAG TPA: glycoside hydrolase family 44 protein [Thermoanaerobaculaceae bacterium]|nr:glycoside hydrolase family 44 protein [Thermoanaerobaculaceae bacterium]